LDKFQLQIDNGEVFIQDLNWEIIALPITKLGNSLNW
jgi:hypothetical protein